MAGMLLTAAINFIPVASKTTHIRSKFLSPHHVSSNKRRFGSSVSNKCSMVQRKPNSVSRSLIIRNSSPNDDSHPPPLQESVVPNFLVYAEPLLNFAANNILPLALIGGISFALTNPGPGCLAHTYQLSKFCIIAIFFVTGLTLHSEEIGEAVKAWPVGLFGITSILLLTPLFSRIMVQFHLEPQEFVTGLALYNCMPTAISSAISLTRLAGGNAALALAMTVLSSLLGIIIVPFSISKLVAGGFCASVPAGEMFRSLIVTLLIPLILGKVFRDSCKGVADIVDNNRKFLSSLGAILISLIPWMQVSKSKPLLLMVKPGVALVAIIMGVLLHLVLLCFNAFLIHVLCAVSGGKKSIFAKKQNYNTLLLVASQKTVSVLVVVVEQLGGTFGESGLLILPCVAAHISQVIIDTLIVSFWNKKHPLAIANGETTKLSFNLDTDYSTHRKDE